jgi:hypothetical protein
MSSISKLTVRLPNGDNQQVAVKHIPSPLAHPDPSTMSLGDCRKATAYQVEANIYEHVAPALNLRLPEPYTFERKDKSITMCLEWIDGRTFTEDRTKDALSRMVGRSACGVLGLGGSSGVPTRLCNSPRYSNECWLASTTQAGIDQDTNRSFYRQMEAQIASSARRDSHSRRRRMPHESGSSVLKPA